MNGSPGPGLSSEPHYRNNPPPEYPAEARRKHQEGIVMLSVTLTAEGHPNNVSLSRSSGFPELDRAALRAVRYWAFEPATVGGIPVPTRVDVPVRFILGRRY